MDYINRRELTMTKNKVLLIGTDKPMQDMFTGLLETDYDIVPLADSAQGASYIESSNTVIDMVIMDLNEAVQNQFQLLAQIRAHYAYGGIAVLALAEPNQTDDIAKCLMLGVDDIITRSTALDITKKRLFNLLSIGKSRTIHNVMEDLIESVVNENVETLGICPCPKCRRDLLTLTLNNVTPKYISTEKGGAMIKATQLASINDRIQLLAEVTHFAELISKNPRHS